MNANLHAVIMAGGVGSRFWPMSTKKKPKQFLDILGTGKTLLQLTFDRLNKIIEADHIWIVTHKDYKEITTQQLPGIDKEKILLEPERKNTAACILYAAKHIEQVNANAIVFIAPSDHLILDESQFCTDIIEAQHHLDQFPDHVLTFGIKASRPDTGYGYIRYDSSEKNPIKLVRQFVEKPDHKTAEHYLASGQYLWNSGMFMWKNHTILDLYSQHAKEISELFRTYKPGDDVTNVYQNSPSISVDYAIMEKTEQAHVMAVDFGWSDLGTWASLYEVLPKDTQQNALLSKLIQLSDSNENIVLNEEDNKLIALQGIENLIIINTPARLLICNKSQEQEIKQLVTQIEQNFGPDQI